MLALVKEELFVPVVTEDEIFNIYQELSEINDVFSSLNVAVTVNEEISEINKLSFVRNLESLDLILCDLNNCLSYLNCDQMEDVMSIVNSIYINVCLLGDAFAGVNLKEMFDVYEYDFSSSEEYEDLPF